MRYCGKSVAMHHQRRLERDHFWWFLHFMDVCLFRQTLRRNMSKKDKLYEYLDEVIHAKIDGKAKGLLYFYATVYNWTKNRPSYWSERSICAVTSMAPSTYQEKRKYLEELGWIVVKNRGREITALVGVKVGRNDPQYEMNCWAKWHPYTQKDDLDNFWNEVEEDEQAKFQISDELVLKLSTNSKEEIDDIWGVFESR